MAIGYSDYPGAVDTASTLLRARALRSTALRFPVGATDTVVPLISTAGFPPDGAVLVEDEVIVYAGLTETDLTGCIRGAFQDDGYGPATAHAIGAPVILAPLAAHHRVLADAVVAVQQRANALLGITVNDQTGTSYTLAETDRGALVRCTNANAIAVQVPAGLAGGFRCQIVQGGGGRVTLSGASGVGITNRLGYTKTAGPAAVVELIAYGANLYYLTGDTGA